MSPATEGFSVMIRDLDIKGAGIELSYRVFASQTSLRGTRGTPVSLWLAQLNEVFSGQLLDQTL
jgi:hypothetical protein